MFPFREDRIAMVLAAAALVAYLLLGWRSLGAAAALLAGYVIGRRSAFVQVDKANFEKAYPGEKWED